MGTQNSSNCNHQTLPTNCLWISSRLRITDRSYLKRSFEQIWKRNQHPFSMTVNKQGDDIWQTDNSTWITHSRLLTIPSNYMVLYTSSELSNLWHSLSWTDSCLLFVLKFSFMKNLVWHRLTLVRDRLFGYQNLSPHVEVNTWKEIRLRSEVNTWSQLVCL